MSSHESDTRTKILEATWKLMEERRGQGVRMSDIAKAAGVSRQAVYLHFATRVELMSATTRYVDEIKGLDDRLKTAQRARNAVELLETYIDIWGGYLPEIQGLAKALLAARDEDEAADRAWSDCMGCLKDICRESIEALYAEGKLATHWNSEDAIELLWTLLSFQNWEQLTRECGWSNEQYTAHIKTLTKRAFVA